MCKAGFEMKQRIDGRFGANFAEQINCRGANIHVCVPLDYFDQPLLHIWMALGVKDIDNEDANVRVWIGQQRSQDGRYLVTQLLEGLDHIIAQRCVLTAQAIGKAAAYGWIVQSKQRIQNCLSYGGVPPRASDGSPAWLKHRDKP